VVVEIVVELVVDALSSFSYERIMFPFPLLLPVEEAVMMMMMMMVFFFSYIVLDLKFCPVIMMMPI